MGAEVVILVMSFVKIAHRATLIMTDYMSTLTTSQPWLSVELTMQNTGEGER
jgi:hypothetical protein